MFTSFFVVSAVLITGAYVGCMIGYKAGYESSDRYHEKDSLNYKNCRSGRFIINKKGD